MKITKDNLNYVLFENHDARLLIEDVVTHTNAALYYYHDTEITLRKALDIWYKVQNTEYSMDNDKDESYGVSFLDFSKEKIPKFELLCS